MNTILVTGGCGFIGSNFIKLLLKERSDWNVFNLDKITYAANKNFADSLSKNKRYKFIRGDITNADLVNKIFSETRPDYIVHFAAESHVDRSIKNARPFLETNINGTHILLETNRLFPSKIFLYISTDEVYGETMIGSPSPTETTKLNPSNPYSVSKAAADMLVQSYNRTYGLKFITVRLCNNYGPSQYPEKLIPLMIRNMMSNQNLPVYGDGNQVRDWLYVGDAAKAILDALEKGTIGEIYNISAQKKLTNLQLVKDLCKFYSEITDAELQNVKNLIKFVPDRPGHDYRYALNDDLFRTHTGWEPKTNFEDGLKNTIEWYISNYSH